MAPASNSETTRFPKMLKAVMKPDATQGAIGEALRADIRGMDERTEKQADRAVNIFDECAAYLHRKGYEFDAGYLRALYRAAVTTAPEDYLRE